PQALSAHLDLQGLLRCSHALLRLCWTVSTWLWRIPGCRSTPLPCALCLWPSSAFITPHRAGCLAPIGARTATADPGSPSPQPSPMAGGAGEGRERGIDPPYSPSGGVDLTPSANSADR